MKLHQNSGIALWSSIDFCYKNSNQAPHRPFPNLYPWHTQTLPMTLSACVDVYAIDTLKVLNRPHTVEDTLITTLALSAVSPHIRTDSRVFHSLTSYQPRLCKLSTGRENLKEETLVMVLSSARRLILLFLAWVVIFVVKQPNSFIVWMREIEISKKQHCRSWSLWFFCGSARLIAIKSKKNVMYSC